MTRLRRLWLIVVGISVAGGLCFLGLLKDRRTSVSTHPKPVTSGKVASGEPTTATRTPPQENGLFGQVIDAAGCGVPGATVEAGVFEGSSPGSLVRKALAHSTKTNSSGDFSFPTKEFFVRAEEGLKSKRELSEWFPEGLRSLLVASKEGYCAARYPVDFHLAKGPLRILLEKNPEVSGKVIWKDTQEPVAGVRIICELESSDMYQPSEVEGRADDVGHFTRKSEMLWCLKASRGFSP